MIYNCAPSGSRYTTSLMKHPSSGGTAKVNIAYIVNENVQCVSDTISLLRNRINPTSTVAIAEISLVTYEFLM